MKRIINSFAAELITAAFFILMFTIALSITSCSQYREAEDYDVELYELATIIDRLEDTQEWIQEDVFNGELQPEVAENMMRELDLSIDYLQHCYAVRKNK